MSYFTGIMGLNPAQVTALIARNEPDGVAGLYACKTILNEHRPACTKEYHLTGKYLDGADNPDVWYPIAAGTGSVVYATRYLTITSSTGASAGNRAVIDQTKFPIAGNFIEVTCKIGSVVEGAGGNRYIDIGFSNSFASHGNTRANFFCTAANYWVIGYVGGTIALTACPLGRMLQAGDIVSVRLDRQEGSSDIDIARFYVNGQKQFETVSIPTVDVYAGIGVYNDASTTDAMSFSTDYFGVRYVP
ncbi:hypothetical protein [Bacteroides sp.]|uniref:hypothetical protein n=1 Tax=Bacteroides sp. TaxID=29523 RepID=UPI002639143F|nr:hypothetical protein [Bacteroides sp.]MDD3041167.1 hypothetical protein [Bacteroides sp.]